MIPAITHSVVFKCIGAHKESRYREVLALVAKKQREDGTVPDRIQKEPNYPVDAHAISFACKVSDYWERIGMLSVKPLMQCTRQ